MQRPDVYVLTGDPDYADVGALQASCPVCDHVVSRCYMGLLAHLSAHVRAGLITKDERRAIMGRLMRKHC